MDFSLAFLLHQGSLWLWLRYFLHHSDLLYPGQLIFAVSMATHFMDEETEALS